MTVEAQTGGADFKPTARYPLHIVRDEQASLELVPASNSAQDLLEGESGLYPELVEVGNYDHERMPLACIIELRQIRDEYDEEALDALTETVDVEFDDNGRMLLDVINSSTINRMTREEFEQYIRDHTDFYEGKVPPIDIDSLPTWNGLYNVRVNGHRRKRAIVKRCVQFGVSPDAAWVKAQIRYGLTFDQAHANQSKENTYASQSPEEDARKFSRFSRYQKRHGRNSSAAFIAGFYGCSESKVRDGLRFDSAPQEIIKYMGDGLTYGNIVNLMRLCEAYKQKYFAIYQLGDPRREATAVHAEAERRTINYMKEQLIRYLEKGHAKSNFINEKINGQVATIQQDAMHGALPLFMIEEVPASRQGRIISRRLANAAINIVGNVEESDGLSLQEIETLRRVLSRAEARLAELGVGDCLVEEVDEEPDLFSLELE